MKRLALGKRVMMGAGVFLAAVAGSDGACAYTLSWVDAPAMYGTPAPVAPVAMNYPVVQPAVTYVYPVPVQPLYYYPVGPVLVTYPLPWVRTGYVMR